MEKEKKNRARPVDVVFVHFKFTKVSDFLVLAAHKTQREMNITDDKNFIFLCRAL